MSIPPQNNRQGAAPPALRQNLELSNQMEEYVSSREEKALRDRDGFAPEWKHSTQRAQVITFAVVCIIIAALSIAAFIAIGAYGRVETGYAEDRQDVPALLSKLDKETKNSASQKAMLSGLEAASPRDSEAIDRQNAAVRSADFAVETRRTELQTAPQLRADFITKRDRWNRATLIAGLCLLPMVGLLLLVFVSYRSSKRLELMQVRRFRRADALAEWRELSDAGRRLSLREQMGIYQRIVINYTRASRRVALVSLALGIGLVGTVITIGLFKSDSNVQAVSSAILGTATAGLGAFLGSTVIANLKDSQDEMLAFFRYPAREEGIISAKILAADIDDAESSSLAQLEIVRGILNDNLVPKSE